MQRDEANQSIRDTGWLAGMPEAFCAEILSRCRMMSFGKGRIIFTAGDPAGGLYGLASGLVRVEYFIPSVGSQTSHLGHPGQWIGVMSGLRRTPREVTLIANTDSEFLYLPLQAFDEMAREPEYLRAFTELIAENQATIMEAVRDLLNPDIPARIAGRLISAVGWQPGGQAREVEVTQSELAMICNVSRKTINKELGHLSDCGLVSLAYGRLSVVDPVGLQEIAQKELRPTSGRESRRATPRVRIQGSPPPLDA